MNPFSIDITRPIVLPSGVELVYSVKSGLWESTNNDLIVYSSGRLYQIFGVDIPYKELPWYGEAIKNGWSESYFETAVILDAGLNRYRVYENGGISLVTANGVYALGRKATPLEAIQAVNAFLTGMVTPK